MIVSVKRLTRKTVICQIKDLTFVYFYAKAVDECCMVKEVKGSELREGDWLYKDVKVGKSVVKASWEGVEEKEIKLLKGVKKVLIREGIAFVPVFLISFLVLVYFWFSGLIWYF